MQETVQSERDGSDSPGNDDGEELPAAQSPVSIKASERTLSQFETIDKSFASAEITAFDTFQSGLATEVRIQFKIDDSKPVSYCFTFTETPPDALSALVEYLETTLSSAPATTIGKKLPAFRLEDDWRILIPPSGVTATRLHRLDALKHRYLPGSQTTLATTLVYYTMLVFITGALVQIFLPMLLFALLPILMFGLSRAFQSYVL